MTKERRNIEFSGGENFLHYSPEVSLRYQDQLNGLQAEINSIIGTPSSPQTTLISLSSVLFDGVASPCYGLIGVSEKVITHPDKKIALFTLAHELTHLQVGSEFRNLIANNHREVDEFFHSQIIADWLSKGKVPRHDEDYIDHKGWDGLYRDWKGPTEITITEALEAIDNYFAIMKKGKIVSMPADIYSMSMFHPFPNMPTVWEQSMKKPDISIEELYASDPEGFVTQVMTGYELASYLSKGYKNTLSYRVGADVWGLEEGYANFIASCLVGISLDEVNRVAPQDEGNLEIAKLIMNKKPEALSAYHQVKSHKDLLQFYKGLNII